MINVIGFLAYVAMVAIVAIGSLIILGYILMGVVFVFTSIGVGIKTLFTKKKNGFSKCAMP